MGNEQIVSVRGVLFDMDGVLVSSVGSAERCWRQWAAHYGVPNADQVHIEHGTRAVDIMEQLRPGVDKQTGLRLIEDMEIADVGDLQVLPGVRDLLASLPEEQWAIVTSATRRLLLGRLNAAQLPLPQRIISGEMVQRGKPAPEPYLRGAALVGAPASACLVVEDAPSGVRAGVQAGCRVLGVAGTYPVAELKAAGADWVVTTLVDVHAQEDGEEIQLSMRVK